MVGTAMRVGTLALGLATALAACGGDTSVFGNSGPGGSGTGDGGGTSSQGGAGAQGGVGGVGGVGGTGGTSTGDGGGGAGSPCSVEAYEVALPNIDMVLMYDVSASTGSFATEMSAQVAAFAIQPWREGDRVALNFHPDGPDVCNPGNYTPMDLALTAIPQNATAVQGALQGVTVTGPSPLEPVMKASLLYAVDEKLAASERVVVAVLLMDSQPNNCDTQQQTFIMMANAASSQQVRTFVIALPNQNVGFFDPIAQAGGTGSAIDLSAFGNESQIAAALTMIRRRAVPCAFPIPEPSMGFTGNPNATLEYTPGNGTPETVMKVANEAACGDDGPGWFEAMPTRGVLCPGTCSVYKEDASPTLEVVYGCP